MIKSVCEIFILEVYASVTSDLLNLLKVHVLRIVRQRVPSISQVRFASSDREWWGLNGSEKKLQIRVIWDVMLCHLVHISRCSVGSVIVYNIGISQMSQHETSQQT